MSPFFLLIFDGCRGAGGEMWSCVVDNSDSLTADYEILFSPYSIINERKNHANFQLIIITHDENFLRKLGQNAVMEYYWYCARCLVLRSDAHGVHLGASPGTLDRSPSSSARESRSV